MESQPNFEYLCRVCAANTKGRNSVAECVYILKTPSLKDKIEKYLYLSISENDPLPKVLCKTCFRQVEATASLSKIAKHTQKVFRDFMIFTKPGVVRTDYNIGIEPNPHDSTTPAPSTTASSNAPTTATNSSCQTSEVLAAATIAADHTALSTAAAELSTQEQLLHLQHQQQQQQQQQQQLQQQHHHQSKHQHQQQKQQQQQPEPASHKDEVIVNVSINDPLTRENSQKMINASQIRQNSLDSKFTPKSIAQRGFTSTPKMASSSGSLKSIKNSTPGVLNFMGGQLHPQVTTFTSGGYVIGRMTTAAAITNTERPVESSHVLQQKRKNLKLALNNIRASALANSSGQVSLLKSSQKLSESNTATKEVKDTGSSAVAEQATTSGAAVKRSSSKLKSKSPARSSTQQRVTEKQPTPLQPTEPIEQGATEQAQQQPPPQEAPPQTTPQAPPSQATQLAPPPQTQTPAPTAHPSGIPDDIVLGRVIRDPDLLKLILKALKWPVNKQTLDMQMQRLRSSKFLEVMSDQNLLQDMDLTQILGPYLAPVLMAAQAIQQQQWAMASAAVVAKEAATAAKQTSPPPPLPQQNQSQTKSNDADVQTMPYKLPAETSVQLINVNSNTSNNSATTNDLKEATKQTAANHEGSSSQPSKMLPPRKIRKVGSQKTRDALIVISDEEENELSAGASRRNSRRRLSKSTPEVSPKFNVDIDPSFLSQYGISTLCDDTANDALVALLNRQRAALTRLQRGQRRRRNSNGNLPTEQNGAQEPAFNIEDIVLMEQRTPLIENEEPPTEKESSTLTVSTSDSSLSTMRIPSFQLPAQVSMPLITRPIIKRRKTVIQASPARTSLNVHNNLSSGTTTNNTLTTSFGNTMPLSTVAPTNSFLGSQTSSEASSFLTMESTATQVPSTVISIATQVPSLEKRLVAGSETTFTARISNYSSVGSSKASSGASSVKTKKLNPSKSALGQQLLEAVGLQKIHGQISTSSNDNANKTTASTTNKKQDSKQKPARKLEEPTVADADSTTKNVVKEVLVEAKQKNLSNSSVNFDVEEQIDKVALVVQSCVKQLGLTNRTEPAPQQEQEKKQTAQAARITDGRRRLSIVGTNRARKAGALLTDNKIDTELNTIEEVKEDSDSKTQEVNYGYDEETDEAEESEKLDVSTSSTTTDQSVASSDTHLPMISPRKRGRKRNEDNDPDFVEHRYKKNSDSVPMVRERGRGRAAALVAKQRVRDMENESKTKMDFEKPSTSSSSSSRPARISKTLSKYYKGPDKFSSSRRGESSGGRITRKRN